jgi:hypothetical protein
MGLTASQASKRPTSQRPNYLASAQLRAVNSGAASPDSTNPAGCSVQISDAHISSYYLRRGIRAAKVNAFISCEAPVSDLSLTVQLWKTGLIFDHLQAQNPTTYPYGSRLNNTGTWKQCANTTSSTFYGDAYASVWENGVQYTASVQSPHNTTLACGT